MPRNSIAPGYGVGSVRMDRPKKHKQTPRQLTEKQRLFIKEYLRSGGSRAVATRNSGVSRGYGDYVLGLPEAVDEIHRLRHNWLQTDLAEKASAVLVGLLDREDTPARVRFEAARYVLGLAGHEKQEDNQALDADKPLTEMSLAELQTFINAGTDALESLKNQRLKTIEGDAVRTADSGRSAQDSAQVSDGDDWIA